MDPSSHNWIDKFFNDHYRPLKNFDNFKEVYSLSRNTGLALGHTTHIPSHFSIDTQHWSREDLSKVALFNTLHNVYQLVTNDNSKDAFISKLSEFYQNIHKETFSLSKTLLPKDKPTIQVEKILKTRIQTKNKIINKNFYHIATNAILFSDVLAFHKYLNRQTISITYFSKLEETIVTIVSSALQKKQEHNSHDQHFIRLFEDSLRFTDFDEIESHTLDHIDITYFNNEIERYYLLDICVLCLYNDKKLELFEYKFIQTVALKLELNKSHYQESIDIIFDFIKRNETEIIYFNPTHPIKNFYNHTTKSIHILLKRNTKRIINELENNQELVQLVGKSTINSLDQSEKKLLKKHVINLCKTIPSLAIFLLPGGTLILPILIKFIPQLLPSSFNENMNSGSKLN